MSSESSYYDDYSGYEFNPYDSDSWPEPDSSPILEDDSQMFHRDQLHETSTQEILEPPPIPVYDDNSTALCTSIDQSRQFIHQNFGLSPSSLRSSPLVGLVILSIKDYNLIRKDHRNNRKFPHLLVVPNGKDFQLVHKDFEQCINILHQ